MAYFVFGCDGEYCMLCLCFVVVVIEDRRYRHRTLILKQNRASKIPGGGGEKGGTPVGPKDRTDKGNILTEDTPRDAVTNALRLHLHNFAYNTFKIKLSYAHVLYIYTVACLIRK